MVPELSRKKLPTYELVKVAVENDVIHIILNNPKQQNAIDLTMTQELTYAFEWALQEKGKLILLEAETGVSFSNGIDMDYEKPEMTSAMIDSFSRLLMTVHMTEKLVVCAIDGTARHKGVALALCCDIILMSEMGILILTDASLGRFSPFAAYLLPQMLSWPRAMEMLMSEGFIKADRAEEIGLANRMLPRKNFKLEVDYYIHRHLKNSSLFWERQQGPA
jgi:enoyl-CoA hydratase/carnithine racemase